MNISVQGNTLTMTVDLTQAFGLSKSGKTEIVASTDGFVQVPGFDGVAVGVNVTKAKGK